MFSAAGVSLVFLGVLTVMCILNNCNEGTPLTTL